MEVLKNKRRVFGIALCVMTFAMRLGAMSEEPVGPGVNMEIEIAPGEDAAAGEVEVMLKRQRMWLQRVTWEHWDDVAADENGDWPLLRATKAFNVTEVKRLLELRADPSVPDSNGYASFWHACMINPRSKDRYSGAWPKIIEHQQAVVKLLYGAGADDEKVMPEKLCPAVWRAIISADRVLQEKEPGGAVSHPLKLRSRADVEGLTSLDLTRHFGGEETILEYLYMGLDIDISDVYERTFLHKGVSNDQRELVLCLLECKANIEAKNEYGMTPLHVAARCNKPEMALLLLNHGANVSPKDNGKYTPLHRARQAGDRVVENLLLQYGAEDCQRESQGISEWLLPKVVVQCVVS